MIKFSSLLQLANIFLRKSKANSPRIFNLIINEIPLGKKNTPIIPARYLHFEGEVLLEVLDDHDEEGKLDAQCFLRIRRTVNERCAAQQKLAR